MDRTVFARSVLRRCVSAFGSLEFFRLKPVTVATAFALALAGGLGATPAWATTIAAGAIAGAPGVSPSGAATYGIPITLPPGTQGMQPSLSLVYNSQDGNGLAGYGWTVSGFSAITRCTQNIDDDGQTYGILMKGPPNDSSSDEFCLDGQELKVTNGGGLWSRWHHLRHADRIVRDHHFPLGYRREPWSELVQRADPRWPDL